APDGVGTSIGRQLGRPLQIETLAAGLLLVAHETTGMGLEWSSSHGSQNLDGAVAGTLAVLSSLLQVGALAGCWIAFARGPASRDRLVRFLALALVVFVAFGKVLSPQFLVWLLFAVPLVAGAAGRRAGVLYAAAAACTAIWFPALYWELVREFDPVSSWLVLLRGLLLTGVVVVLARDSGRDGGQLRKSSRDRDARGRTPIMR
ncbi:MAG TPA: hypothetical protein VJ689_08735, partial [Gaiellaceae bacterium]|nr:hypothetical protein [Gaiellaceae bacterium]